MPRLRIVLCLLAMASGCASVRPLGPIEPGRLPAMLPDEGILIVHLHTKVPIATLKITRLTALTDLPAGEHLRFLAVTAGKHRWSEVVVTASGREIAYRVPGSDLYGFRVEPGRLNYAGELSFEARIGLYVSIQNRSGQILRTLRKRYPALLERYPPIYAGLSRDDYLDHYARNLLTVDLGQAPSPGAEEPAER